VSGKGEKKRQSGRKVAEKVRKDRRIYKKHECSNKAKRDN
jgi:hypothetical protein